ncbi:MAG TPA: OmpH family outer membrane protein [Croceibacterium sp.]|nr:OmpH family outer membrane protein [Croceibacterium sp.]
MNARILGAASLALSVVAAVPAAAQVNGVAVADPAVAVAGSQALQAAYQQIATTFAAQRTQLEQLQQQRSEAVRQFDTDGDGQLSQEEQTAAQANTTVMQQVQGLEQQINAAQQPITRARVYVIEQLAQQLSPAVQQVVQANNVQLILNPNSALYIGDSADVTDEIIAQLNQLAPTVSSAAPEGWQPQQQSVQLYQQVSEILLTVALQQQAQAQQGQQGQPQAQQPAATPVQGR